MPAYRIHLAKTATEPFPPVDSLPVVNADDPLVAADTLAAEGISADVKWARVILELHPDGKPKRVLRVPMGGNARQDEILF